MFIGIKTLNNETIQINMNLLGEYSFLEILNTYINLWYFSMITFATVGYGDMIVTTPIGKILVSIEVFFGVTIAATWTSVIIKRMTR
jgi:voltage-gated potassium channel Kch